MNNINKTEAAGFPCRLSFLRDFPFISLIKSVTCKILHGTIVFQWIEKQFWNVVIICLLQTSALKQRWPTCSMRLLLFPPIIPFPIDHGVGHAWIIYPRLLKNHWKNKEYSTHKSNSSLSHIDIGGVSANRNIETMISRWYIKPFTLFLNDLGICCAWIC